MTVRYDVFLSHNGREKPVVERLAQKLKEANLEPWFDKWCLTPGGRWQEEVATGLKTSVSCAVFIGQHDAGDWEREELSVALTQAARDRGFRVFLVLLPGVEEPFDVNRLSPFLSTRTWVDLRQGIEQAQAFQALVNAIKGVPLGPTQPSAESSGATCPYRGLEPFDSEHSEFYFGRDREIQRLVESLKSNRFLSVLGPSGSGKSSLVRAGLVPALHNGILPGSHEWPIVVFTPTADPLTQLAAQFVRFGSQASMQDTLDRMSADPRTLHLAATLVMADRPPAARVVWVVDQFEEVFTLCRNESHRAQFISNLLHASSPEGRSVIVITLRADFYQRCAAYIDLAARVAANQFLVSPMDVEGLRQAIEEPARLAGLEFEEGLVETLVEAVAGQPGVLPLLEHSLLELWERRRARLLTLEGYRESGGVQGAIARRADAILDSFDAAGQAAARRVLLRLTQIGEGTEDTRRRAPLRELATNKLDTAVVDDVVRAWTDARLMTSTSDASGEPWVTVSHEALIRAWPRLRKWIDEDRAGQRLHRQITEGAAEWQRLGRDESALWRGVRLAPAGEYRVRHEDSLNELERQFLDASLDRQHETSLLAIEHETARALAAALTIDEAALRILEALCSSLGWKHGALWILDREADVLRCSTIWSPPAAPLLDAIRSPGMTFKRGIDLPGRVWATGQPAWIPDVPGDATSPGDSIGAGAGQHDAFAFPVMLRGDVLSVMEFLGTEIREPDRDLLSMLTAVGNQIGMFIERRRAQDELDRFFNLSFSMFCIAGFDGYFKRVNPAWQRLLGYTEEELLSRPYLDFVHPDDREVTQVEAKKLEGGEELELVYFENRYFHKDGTLRWLMWAWKSFPEQQVIYATARDISERKAAEETLATYARELEASQERLAQLVRELGIAKRRAEDATEARSTSKTDGQAHTRRSSHSSRRTGRR